MEINTWVSTSKSVRKPYRHWSTSRSYDLVHPVRCTSMPLSSFHVGMCVAKERERVCIVVWDLSGEGGGSRGSTHPAFKDGPPSGELDRKAVNRPSFPRPRILSCCMPAARRRPATGDRLIVYLLITSMYPAPIRSSECMNGWICRSVAQIRSRRPPPGRVAVGWKAGVVVLCNVVGRDTSRVGPETVGEDYGRR